MHHIVRASKKERKKVQGSVRFVHRLLLLLTMAMGSGSVGRREVRGRREDRAMHDAVMREGREGEQLNAWVSRGQSTVVGMKEFGMTTLRAEEARGGQIA
jgi:hypothetical protein